VVRRTPNSRLSINIFALPIQDCVFDKDFAFEWKEYKVGRIRSQGEKRKKKQGKMRDLKMFRPINRGVKGPY
jgi:hypothetical protein